jgi:hypothetical protein
VVPAITFRTSPGAIQQHGQRIDWQETFASFLHICQLFNGRPFKLVWESFIDLVIRKIKLGILQICRKRA